MQKFAGAGPVLRAPAQLVFNTAMPWSGFAAHRWMERLLSLFLSKMFQGQSLDHTSTQTLTCMPKPIMPFHSEKATFHWNKSTSCYTKICQVSVRRQSLKPGSSMLFQVCKLMFVLRSHCKNTQHQQAHWKKNSSYLFFLWLQTFQIPTTRKRIFVACCFFWKKYKNCSKAAWTETPKSISHCHTDASTKLCTITE